MDFEELLRDAWGYTDAGILKNTGRWMRLILAVICLGIPFNGYLLRVYRGASPAPEVDDWGTLFVDGLKVLAIGFVYILPLMILMLILIGAMMVATIIGGGVLGIIAGVLGVLANLLFYILEFIVIAFLPVAYIRFARTGIFAEAFNFSAMRETIEKIGWLTYIIAVILITLVIVIPLCIVFVVLLFLFIGAAILFSNNLAVVLGLLAVLIFLFLLIIPVISIFQARYLTRVYGSAGE